MTEKIREYLAKQKKRSSRGAAGEKGSWKTADRGKAKSLQEDTGSCEAAEKIVQYMMTACLLGLAFVLPGLGMKLESGQNQDRQAAVQQVESDDGRTEEEGKQGKGKIVLDPGHGGDDPGMIGAGGMNEKVLNLVYAKKLEALLVEKGYQVVMTRTTEDGLYDADQPNKKAQDMQRRCAVIEEEQPLVAVSIHQNSYPDSSVSGPQVFYYEHSAEGERLAALIQNSMNEQLAVERPRVHKGNTSYYILKRSASVTVIVECGFLSNPQEEAKLQEEAYQDQVAQAVCDGIVQYLEGENR